MVDFEKLTELIIELEVDDIQTAVKEALETDGKDPFEVLNALTKGMDEVGRRYEAKEYYLTDIVEICKKDKNYNQNHCDLTINGFEIRTYSNHDESYYTFLVKDSLLL